MNIKNEFYRKKATKIVKEMEKRNFKANYYETAKTAIKDIIDFIPQGSSVSWGGSETIKKIGLIDELKMKNFIIFDREECKSQEEITSIYHKALSADYFFMSSNAITMDGLLVNTDGRGNRLTALVYGPKKIIVIAGMNKVVSDERAARERMNSIAAPMNAMRLKRNTPCTNTGNCADCQSPDSVCCNTVITRRSFEKNRINVFLIGEELGY